MANPVAPSPQLAVVPFAGKSAAQPAAAAGRQEAVADGKSVPAVAVNRAAATSPPSAEVAQATREISSYIQTVNRSLQISVEQDLGTTVITVIDEATEEVVRQIPSEDILALARFIAEQQQELGGVDLPVRGLLMDSEG